ncbi:Uncharacterised protein [Mycobacteroides abscessus]|nr:Uncharacterised protein [Mycobacteroides abscessus]
MHDDTSFSRDACVAAAREKFFDQVQPPIEMSARSCGFFALSCLSWLNEPASGWSHASATPPTEFAAV